MMLKINIRAMLFMLYIINTCKVSYLETFQIVLVENSFEQELYRILLVKKLKKVLCFNTLAVVLPTDYTLIKDNPQD